MSVMPPVVYNPVLSLWPKATIQGAVKEAPRSKSVIRSAPMSGFSVAGPVDTGDGRAGLGGQDSVGSILSLGSAGSILSIGSAGSILSIGSAGSVLSMGSAGSILSIGSVGSVASIGSAFSLGAIGGWCQGRPRVVETAATVMTLAALATAALSPW